MIQQNIQRAALERRVLKISYLDKKGTHTIRSVEPYEIKNGKLWAHCLQRNGIRQFELNRIVQAVLSDRSFAPRHEVKIRG